VTPLNRIQDPSYFLRLVLLALLFTHSSLEVSRVLLYPFGLLFSPSSLLSSFWQGRPTYLFTCDISPSKSQISLSVTPLLPLDFFQSPLDSLPLLPFSLGLLLFPKLFFSCSPRCHVFKSPGCVLEFYLSFFLSLLSLS